MHKVQARPSFPLACRLQALHCSLLAAHCSLLTASPAGNLTPQLVGVGKLLNYYSDAANYFSLIQVLSFPRQMETTRQSIGLC